MSKSHIFAITSLLAGCALEASDEELSTSSTSHEINASRGDDLAVLGSNTAGAGLVVAFSNDDGSFDVSNTSAEYFAALARGPGVKRLSGDFNRDGRTDFALVGGVGWNTIPTAMSYGNGMFLVTNGFVGADFNNWARTANVQALVGDYNKDGCSDIALSGAATWATIPVASSTCDGRFQVANGSSPLAPFAGIPSAKLLVGDYNKDGYSDIAVIGYTTTSPFVPIAFGAGGGSWTFTSSDAGSINAWASSANVRALVGDYNKDGYTDFALVGGAGWASIPVAFSAGGGNFIVTNSASPTFAAQASVTSVTPVVGDFNADGYSDIALTGTAGSTIPTVHSLNGGAFEFRNNPVGANYSSWARTAGVRSLVGDFNADGYSDIALTGSPHWGSIPIASGVGPFIGGFVISNKDVAMFPGAAGDSTATLFVGRVN